MSDVNNHVLRAWEECVISPEKGSRIVHYILRDSTGNSLLAVVGIEMSVNHIIYTPTRDYLHGFGSTNQVHAGTRWKARKDVVNFLKSVTSQGGLIFPDSNQQKMERQHLKQLLFQMTRFSQRSYPAEEMQESGQLVPKNSEIVWLGDARICMKQLKHYPAFSRNETKIPVHSIVWILGGGGKDYLGYIEDMYETLQEEKMVRVRRFLFRQDFKHIIPKLCSESREVFITSTEEHLSAKEIDGLASVMEPSDFKTSDELLPLSLSFKNFMCHREFKNNRVSTFSLSGLCGYSAQPLLSSLKYCIPGPCNDKQNETKEGDDCGPQDQATTTCKRIKIFRPDQTASGINDIAKNNQASTSGHTHEGLKIIMANKGPVKNKLMIEPQNQMLPNDNENVEFLCQDSGMRGCWFRCKILQSTAKVLKVQYYDVEDVSGSGKLEEWVAVGKEAAEDRLGVRCGGRLTVRPWPSWDSSDASFEVGAAVDAWWCRGWWEGVVIGFASSAKSNLQVYFPGENKFMSVERRDVRVSKDWIDKKWVDIMPKHDILSVLTSCLNPMPRVSLPAPVPVYSGSGTPIANSRENAEEDEAVIFARDEANVVTNHKH